MNDSVPLVDIPSASDFKERLEALDSALKHPEYYKEYFDLTGVDIAATTARLIDWLSAHQSQGE